MPPLSLASLAARMAADDFDIPQPSLVGASSLRLWATFYHVFPATQAATGVPLLDMSGNRIGPEISEKAFCHAAVEGTVQLTDSSGTSTTYNFAGLGASSQVDCSRFFTGGQSWVPKLGRTRFAVSKGPFGEGVRGSVLVPFRSIAVDKSTIPYGTVVFIPAARGLAFTGIGGRSLTHDGFFFATDTGGAIKGTHIDVFTGSTTRNPFPGFIKSAADKTFDAHVIDDAGITARLTALHSPS